MLYVKHEVTMKDFFRHFKLPKSIQKIVDNKHFKYGLPFFALLVGAHIALPAVTSYRYEFRRVKGLSDEDYADLAEKGIKYDF